MEAGIRTARDIGAGNGPINHFHSVYALPFAPYVNPRSGHCASSHCYRGRFIEYLLDRPDVKVAWQKHTEHRFLERLADGTLPVELFKNYLIQDYLYLVSSIGGFCTLYSSTPGSICQSNRPGWL